MTQVFYDEKKEYEDSFRRLWRSCFHDPRSYEDFYFQSVYARNQVLALSEDGIVQGMIHLNPYCLQVGQTRQNLHYIVGVATDPKKRRQGVMRKLLTRAMQDMADAGEVFTYLMPADVAYYAPFDFVIVAGFEEVEMYGEAGESHLTPLQFKDYVRCSAFVNRYLDQHYKVHTLFDENVLFFTRWEAMCENGKILVLKKEGDVVGMAAYGQDEEVVYIRQIFGNREEMIGELKNYFGDRKLVLTLPNDEKDDVLIMMRLLRLDLILEQVAFPANVNVKLYIKDDFVPQQNGYFHLYGDGKRGYLERIEEPEEAVDTFTIQEVTRLILRDTGLAGWFIGEIV